MHTRHGDDALAAALGTVAALGTARDREQLMAVRNSGGTRAIGGACGA